MTNLNETIETLFNNFLEATPAGELAEAMHRISAAIDAQIENGGGDPLYDLTADHELAALRNGYYAGFTAALELIGARQVQTIA